MVTRPSAAFTTTITRPHQPPPSLSPLSSPTPSSTPSVHYRSHHDRPHTQSLPPSPPPPSHRRRAAIATATVTFVNTERPRRRPRRHDHHQSLTADERPHPCHDAPPLAHWLPSIVSTTIASIIIVTPTAPHCVGCMQHARTYLAAS